MLFNNFIWIKRLKVLNTGNDTEHIMRTSGLDCGRCFVHWGFFWSSSSHGTTFPTTSWATTRFSTSLAWSPGKETYDIATMKRDLTTHLVLMKSQRASPKLSSFLAIFLKLDYSKVTHLLVSSSLSRGAEPKWSRNPWPPQSVAVLQILNWGGNHNQELNRYIEV